MKDKKQKYSYYSQVGFWYLVFIFVLVTAISYSGIVPWLSDQFYNYITQDVQGQVAGEYEVRMAQTQSPDPKLLTTNVFISSIKQKIKNGEQPWKGQYDAIMVTANKLRDKYNGQTAEPCLSNPSFVSKIRCVGSDGRTGVPPGGEFINFWHPTGKYVDYCSDSNYTLENCPDDKIETKWVYDNNGNVKFATGYNPLDYNLVYWDGLVGNCLTNYKDPACQRNGYAGWTNLVNYSDYYPIVLALAIVYSDNPSPYVPVLKDYMLAWTNMELNPYPNLLYSNVLRYDSLMMDMMVAYDLTKNYLNLTTTEQQTIEDWMHDVVGDKIYEYYLEDFNYYNPPYRLGHNVHICDTATINLYARLFNDTAKITETEEHTKTLFRLAIHAYGGGGVYDDSKSDSPWNNHNGLQLECMSYIAITAFNNGGIDLFNYIIPHIDDGVVKVRPENTNQLDDAYTFYSPVFEWLGTEPYDKDHPYEDWSGYHGLIEIGNTFLQNTANQQVLKDNPNFKRVATDLYRNLRFIRYPVLFWGTDVNTNNSSCSDTTAANTCSTTKPFYCFGGNLVNNCSQCGCPSGQLCQNNGSCGIATVPAVPDNLQPNDLTATSVRWTWNAVSGATGYQVSYSSHDGNKTDDPVSETNYLITTGYPNTSSVFKVKACNSNGCSAETSRKVIFPPPPLFNLTNDLKIGMRDFSILLSNWGQHDPKVDFNGDLTVDDRDLSKILSCWGTPINPDCYGSSSATVCSDGIDNDGNGFVDCTDSACAGDTACSGGGGGGPEICDNGTDDDNDGAIGCADSDCVAKLGLSTNGSYLIYCCDSNDDCPAYFVDNNYCWNKLIDCDVDECNYQNRDVNKQCAGSVCTAAGWNNSACGTADTTKPVVNSLTLQTRADTDPIVLNWSVSDNLSLNRVELYRTTQDSSGNCISSGWTEVEQKTVSGTSATGSFSDNPSAGSYCYGIHVVDTAGNWGVEPNPIKVTKIESLATPSNLTATNITPTSVDWRWDNVTGEDRYEINYSVGGTDFGPINRVANVLGYSVTNGSPNTSHTFRVKACSGSRCSAETTKIITFPQKTTPPAVPSNLTANDLTINSVRWTWTDVTDEDEYRITYVSYGGSQTNLSIPAGTTSYAVITGAPNTSHVFKIRACKAGNCSAEAEQTIIFPPTAPDDAQADNMTTTSVKWTWTDVQGERRYEIRYSIAGTPYGPITLESGTTSYDITGGTAGAKIIFRIRACNDYGCSAEKIFMDYFNQTVEEPGDEWLL